MPLIHVTLFAGRTAEQKRAFAQALTEAAVHSIGATPESVDVIFTDVQRGDWATAGRLWRDPPAAPPGPGGAD
jgi:4-oxalocrotonate tautomerase